LGKKRIVKKKTVKKSVKKAVKKSEAGAELKAWVAEAIQQFRTPEKEFVSFAKIKQYLLDYLDRQPSNIGRLAKQTLLQLLADGLVKVKKDSYAFKKAGLEQLAPATVPDRKKIVREEKVKAEKVVRAAPAKVPWILQTGRTSRPRAFP
jgi:hypothetical protein